MRTHRFFSWTTSLLVLHIARLEAGVTLSDSFDYPDGVLQTVSSGKWVGHSGTTNQVDVSHGVLNLTGAESQDVNAQLDGQPFQPTNNAVLFARFKIKLLALPSTGGSYFAHFKDAGGGFRGRVWTLKGDAGTNAFRVGIGSASGTAPSVVWTNELRLATEYVLVTRLVVTNSVASLWINPASEADPNISSEPGTALSITSFAFRQASGIGTMTIDDLLVGTAFGDVVPPQHAPVLGQNPTISKQPERRVVKLGESAVFTVDAEGAEPLGFQWQFNGSDLNGATNRVLTLASVGPPDQGDYRVTVWNAFGTATSAAASLIVDAPLVPPAILEQPLSLAVASGQTATFSVTATGSEPLSYQWRINGTDVGGATRPTLTFTNVTLNHSGTYWVRITNAVGMVESEKAVLRVELPPPPPLTNIAALRASVDPKNFLPADTNTLFTVEGIVTTHVNLAAPPDALFYFQDASAGIAVFWRGGATTVPQAGNLVRVTAPLTHFNGLLELAPDTASSDHAVAIVSSRNPLPDPRPLDFAWQSDAALLETREGQFVVASNVFLDLSNPVFRASGENLTMTNANGEKFTVRIDARTDIPGQPKPLGAVTIFGVLGQSDTSNPRTSNYQLIPTRFADLVSEAKPPALSFTNILENLARPGDAPTNVFTEHALRPSEKLTLLLAARDPNGREVVFAPGAEGMPVTATWELSGNPGTSPTGTFRFSPTPADAGSNYVVTLEARTAGATNRAVWSIYVPTAAEQQIIISEFLANPATSSSSPHFNPLHRAEPAPSPSSNDEFVELVNTSPDDVDLSHWTISDSVQVRHRFEPPFPFPGSSALVVYGGPPEGVTPVLPVPVVPASEGSAGLGLNNTGGDVILLRNSAGRLISRVVYDALFANGSLTRFPDLNSGFAAHSTVATVAASPGTWPDGTLFRAPPPPEPVPIRLMVSGQLDHSVSLQWNVESGRAYSVLSAAAISGPFQPIVTGLIFNESTGFFTDSLEGVFGARFYRISSP